MIPNEYVPIPPNLTGECVQIREVSVHNVLEIKMHIVRQLGHIDKNKAHNS